MSHAYARNYVHLIFGTKERRPWIKPPVQPTLWTYLAGIAREYGVEALAIGGTEDHVHLLLCLPPKLSVAVVVRALKANTSKWMNESGHLFAWQQGPPPGLSRRIPGAPSQTWNRIHPGSCLKLRLGLTASPTACRPGFARACLGDCSSQRLAPWAGESCRPRLRLGLRKCTQVRPARYNTCLIASAASRG